MGLVKFGAGIVQISGSIAGTTHARNRFGNYIRPRTKPVNPNSDRQVAARARIMLLAEEWSDTLTAAQRLAWATYAAAIAMTNRLGETIYLTGFNHFVRSNAVILQCGSPQVAAGPTTLSLPNGDPTFSCALSAASGITITFDDTFDWADEDEGHLSIEIGQPQLVTRNFFAGPWRYDASVDGDSVTPPTSPDGPNASTTWTLIEGQKAWVRARVVREDGRVSNFFYSPAVTIGA